MRLANASTRSPIGGISSEIPKAKSTKIARSRAKPFGSPSALIT